MKKSKKLVLEKTTIRNLTPNEMGAIGGGLSGIRCTQSSCNSGTCSDETLGCGQTFVVGCA